MFTKVRHPIWVLVLIGIFTLSLTSCEPTPTATPASTPTPTTAYCDPATLIADINAANATPAHDTITLTPSCVYLLTAVDNTDGGEGPNGLPAITTPITIQGNSASIVRDAGAPDFRIFFITDTGNLTLDTLVVSSGTSAKGAGIYNAGILTLIASNLSGNISSNEGGGLYNTGNFNISHTSILHNNEAVYGGALYNYEGTGVITNAAINYNNAANAGGGIYTRGEDAVIDISSVQFLGNNVTTIWTESSPEFYKGGAIYNFFGTINMVNGMFHGNTASEGGAVANWNGHVVFEDVELSENIASEYGGAVSVGGEYSEMHLTECNVSNNTAELGGGVYTNWYAHLEIKYTTVDGNTAAMMGGGLFLATEGTTEVNASTISRNSAVGGGGIYNSGGNLIIHNSTISENHASGNGGGMRADEYSDFDYFVQITFSTIAANNALNGSGVFVMGDRVDVKNSIIANNPGTNCYFGSAGGTINSLGINMDSDGTCTGFLMDTPLLGPLADNGGFTQTHALLPLSPAIDLAFDCTDQNGTAVATDQRTDPRPQGAFCDIGAYEADESVTPSPVPVARRETLCFYAPDPNSDVVQTIPPGTRLPPIGLASVPDWYAFDSPRFPGLPCFLPGDVLYIPDPTVFNGLEIIIPDPKPTRTPNPEKKPTPCDPKTDPNCKP